MLKRIGSIALLASVVALAVAAAAIARPATVTAKASAAAGASCKAGVSIGMLAPVTGPAGSIGSDQLHWAQFYVNTWNKVKGHVKIKLVQGDTQLDPAKATTVGQQFASNAKIMGVVGPAGSDEVEAVASTLRKAGLAFVSGSATRVKLSNGAYKGFFFRVVPNDGVQGPTAADYMRTKLGVGSGDSVMVVDDQESYSTGLADIVGASLAGKGVKVDRESISQKATDFSSLVAKVTSSVKVVFLPFQLASQAQLFAQQLQAQGKKAIVFGSDGTFDSSKFNVNGSYISFFAPDVTTVPANAAISAAFDKAFPGGTSPFGAPNYVAMQVYANAITKACKDNKITRTELRKDFAKVSLKSTLIGPIRFTANGDVANAQFHIFKIVNGKYVTIS
jgi:branched-chain amino acid transport system substrate-binding protein